MMNNQPGTLDLDLDFMSDADDPDAVIDEAREWADNYAHVPADVVSITLVTMSGGGSWPVVRFSFTDPDWAEQLLAEYDPDRLDPYWDSFDAPST